MKALKTFYQKVDKRSRKAMAEFISSHFRYHTMNSWNGSTSWANNLKIYNVLPNELQDKWYEMYEYMQELSSNIESLINNYTAESNNTLTAGFNGRSGGYLVMYECEKKLSGYKSFCTSCYQRNYKTVEETGNAKCGKCGKETRINKNFYELITWSGRSVDNNWTEYNDLINPEWISLSELKTMTEKIQRFDRLCDDIVSETIWWLENHHLEDEEVVETKTIKVVVENGNN